MDKSACKAMIAAAIVALAPAAAMAVGTVSGMIKIVDVRSDGNFLITFDTQPANSPACATDTNKRLSGDANTAGGKAVLGVATAAMVSGKAVWIQGTGACSQYSTIESIAILHATP